MARTNGLGLEQLREKLHDARGPRYWRSLEELADTQEFRDYVSREFPGRAAETLDQPSRRQFLKVMGASLALAGLQGCSRQPEEKILPYVKAPEDVVPGNPVHYATAFTHAGDVLGVLAESHMGRPTKIEGNPLHPASRGATGIFAQASILDLYDPARSQSVLRNGRLNTWENFVAEIRKIIAGFRQNEGAGLRILTGEVSSPTLLSQLTRLLERFPQAKWHRFEPIDQTASQSGTEQAFGQALRPVPRLKNADVVVSFDADFLYAEPGQVTAANDFAKRRRLSVSKEGGSDAFGMNRLYVLESTPTVTGANADHRLSLTNYEIQRVAFEIAGRVGVDLPSIDQPLPVEERFLAAIVDDLTQAVGRSVVLAGQSQPAWVHAVAHALNEQLGNIGSTIDYFEPFTASGPQPDSLPSLVADIEGKQVDTLLIVDGNPAFTAPADLEFAKALVTVPHPIHLSLSEDETSALCEWHLPAKHYLEAWGDAASSEGTISIQQPLIEPLYAEAARSSVELLSAVLDDEPAEGYDVVRDYWRQQFDSGELRVVEPADAHTAPDDRRDLPGVERPIGNGLGDALPLDTFDQFWQQSLHDGVLPLARPEPVQVTRQTLDVEPPEPPEPPTGFEILFRPDPSISDGRYANNGWLQELPKPLTKIVWGNAAIIAPVTAEELGVETGDQVAVSVGRRRVELPAWVLPGQPPRAVTVHLGFGRTQGAPIAEGIGTDVYPLRTTQTPWVAANGQLEAIGGERPVANTQHHHLMEGRDPVQVGTLSQLREHPEHPPFMNHLHLSEYDHLPGHHSAAEKEHAHHDRQPSFYPEQVEKVPQSETQWGMSIDLTTCIGCFGCVVACQSENNIPVVGEEQAAYGREMHWIRVDSYFAGDPADPQFYQQPVPCMHCELAPCEPVCPVTATTHSKDGLNEMTYNRCVGTRYCSNNCPYKVRRFNYFSYTEPVKKFPVLQLLQNPDVTVRDRGVMEKCTYCVQRIRHGQIEAQRENRDLRDGEVVTACQQVCPADAIAFGDIADKKTQVSRRKDSPLDYSLLEELNTRPRTTYRATVRNPHPDLIPPNHSGKEQDEHGH